MRRSLLVLFLVLRAPPWSQAAPAAEQPEIVREDAFFRESLAAIRDWEAILAALEQDPGARGAPVFPVPEDGEEVRWPNPIPRALLPVEDARAEVRVRAAAGGVEVIRVDPAGAVKQQTVAAGETVSAYKHPGGGGKDHWYHAYHRKFDRLTTFRPRPAHFALRIEAPCDFQRGWNELALTIRNARKEPLELAVRLGFRTPGEGPPVQQEIARDLTLDPGATHALRLPVELLDEGGGLLLLTVECGGERFWVPLLTHVETVTALLDGIGRMLVDAPDSPDARAGEQLAALRLAALQNTARGAAAREPAAQEAAAATELEAGQAAARKAISPGGPRPTASTWRALFDDASALRDELLLTRLGLDALLFVKRKPFDSEQPFMDAHHLINRPGGGIYRLSPVRPGGTVTPVVDTLGEGVYRDICLHWDARKLLFSFGNGSDRWDGAQSYHIYEVGAGGEGLRQLTQGPKNDCEPFYLPNGQIGFTSDRSEHFVMCGGDRHSPNLFVMEGDGSRVRQLSFNVFNDFNPAVLPDGRIIYGRWEYNERSVTSLHKPFTIHPDGTMVSPYYGNATIRPNVVMFPRPVPGSGKIAGLFTAHHGQTHGAIGLIDVERGIDGPDPITVLTPGVPVTGEKAEDSLHGWFSDPWPLSETLYLASFTPTVVPWLERSWALYAGDRHGNLALIHRDPAISTAEPVPLVPRPWPHPLPPARPGTDASDSSATVVLLDVYQGLPGVARGTARHLRILEDVPRKGVTKGGVIRTSGTSIYTIKRVIGVVPIEPDGSAHFAVPANRNVYFEVLDGEEREIQRMRSVVCLKPGETRACIGCHERPGSAPPNSPASAASREPSRPVPPPWGDRTVSFLRDVQPLLDAKCVSCHDRDRPSCRVILASDLTDQFSIGYEELLPYISVANAMRWDHPDDVRPRAPYTYGSRASRLAALIDQGHHGVSLTEEEWRRLASWIDSNGVYYDRYETGHYPDRHIFAGAPGEELKGIHARRCAACHDATDGQPPAGAPRPARSQRSADGRSETWWLSLDWRDPARSRALQAPLARAAGGWGRCGEEVFASVDDPDRRRLLETFTALGKALSDRPREDLASVRGEEAGRR